MARFTYRLQSVLNIKLQFETQAKMEFGQAVSKLRTEEDKLTQFKERRLEYIEEGRKLRSTSIDVLELRENENAIKVMDDLISGQVQRVKIAEQGVERARNKLTLAMQERKAQERLKERAFEEFLEEEKKTEAREIDELVSYKYGAGEA